MASILILYASHFGQTRAIATRLAQELRGRHHVELVDAQDRDPPAPDRFDIVVVGSRVEAGLHGPDVRNYLAHHREALRNKPTAFFSVSMAAAAPSATHDPNGYMATLFDEVEWHPTIAVALAGALPYRKYNWFLRFMMKRISRSGGHTTDTSRDHEFTDWQRVHELADQIDGLIARPALAPHG
jgi:menaquinone-dependent protoporphyrinogen oxidase